MKTITDYEIIDHDIEWEQYFQGCGISGTRQPRGDGQT